MAAEEKNNEKAGHAKRLLKTIDPMLAGIEQAERAMAGNPAKVERHLSDDFSWSFLYEIPFPLMQVMAIAAMGHLDELTEAAKAPEPEKAMLALIERDFSIEDSDEGMADEEGLFERQETLALIVAMFRSLKSLLLYGAYMSELVERVRAGSEEAFFDALQIDRTVITCPSVVEFAATWLAKAELLGRKRAITRFIAAMKQQPPKTLHGKRKLRFTLQYMKETGLLKTGEVGRDVIEFIQELGVYARSPGAERSLEQFVRRWQAQKAATPKSGNDVGDSPQS